MNKANKIHSLIKEKLILNPKTVSLNDEVLFTYQRDLTEDPVFIIYENGLVNLMLFEGSEKPSIRIAQMELTDKQKEVIKELYIQETGDLSVLKNEKIVKKPLEELTDDQISYSLAFQMFYVSDLFENEEDNQNINNIELSIYLNNFLTSLEVKFKKCQKNKK